MTAPRSAFALSFAILSIARIALCAKGPVDSETRLAREQYRLGVEAYESGRYAQAIAALKRAYLLKPVPGLLYNIGRTYEKLGDLKSAVYYYEHYLSDAPESARHLEQLERHVDELERKLKPAPPDDRTARTESAPRAKPQAKPEAKTEAKPRKDEYAPIVTLEPHEARPARAPQPEVARNVQPSSPEQEPPPLDQPYRGPMPTQWSHAPIDAAPPSLPLDVAVQSPNQKGVEVVLYYRTPGESDFDAVLMRRRGPEWVARIPPEALTGTTLQYFIEAKRRGGPVLKAFGSRGEPNIVMIDPAAPPHLAESGAATVAEQSASAQAAAPAASGPSPGKEEEERAPLAKEGESLPLLPGPNEQRKAQSSEPVAHGPFTTLGWTGVGLGAAGVLLAGIGAGVGFGYAAVYRNALASDAEHTPLYVFNDPDPTLAANDKSFASRMATFNGVGIASLVVGGALAVTGGALVIVDLRRHGKAKSEKSLSLAPVLSPGQFGLTATLSLP